MFKKYGAAGVLVNTTNHTKLHVDQLKGVGYVQRVKLQFPYAG